VPLREWSPRPCGRYPVVLILCWFDYFITYFLRQYTNASADVISNSQGTGRPLAVAQVSLPLRPGGVKSCSGDCSSLIVRHD
jgi:hypothetical protein